MRGIRVTRDIGNNRVIRILGALGIFKLSRILEVLGLLGVKHTRFMRVIRGSGSY
jgi:hypothetical protein